MVLIKKYGNRRLYDTEASRYITLEELTEKIRLGTDVRVVDAKSNDDLTQATLTQIIIEGRKADTFFPPTLLHQLIRLQDDVLSEFLGRYLQGALELYLQAKRSAATIMPFNPFAALANFANGGGQAMPWSQQAPPPPVAQPPAPDFDSLRRELDDLKKSLRKRRK